MLGLTEKATIFILRFSEWVQLHLVGAKISTYCVARVPITDSALLPHCLSSADVNLHSFNQLVDKGAGMKTIRLSTRFTEKGYSMAKLGQPLEVKL